MVGTEDVDGLLDRMTPSQFDEWCAKDLVEPIGTRGITHLLMRIGLMIAALGNSKGVRPSDLAPWLVEEESAEATPSQMRAMFESLGGRTHGSHR